MTTLNQLIGLAQEIQKDLIESDGILTDELENKISLNDRELAVKVDTYVYVINGLEDRTDEIDARIENLKAIKTQMRNHADFMRAKLSAALEAMDQKEILGNEFKITTKLNPPRVDILDEEKIPDNYKREKISIEIDKKKISEVLKLGIDVDGARLIQERKLVIKENI